MDRFDPNEESWSEEGEERIREAEAEQRALEEARREAEDAVAAQGEAREHKSLRRRVDPSRGMDVEALVRARKDDRIQMVREEPGDDDSDSMDAKLNATFRGVQRQLEDSNYDSSSDRNTLPGGVPVPEPFEHVVRQRALEKRFREGRMSWEEVERYWDADARDRGEPRRDAWGKVIKDKGPPLQGRLPSEWDDIYPNPGQLLVNVLGLIKQHIRNCVDPTCELEVGRDEQWYQDHLPELDYEELLAIWREWEDIAQEDTIVKKGNDPEQLRLIEGEYVQDSHVLDVMWDKRYNVSRCQILPDQHACDLCHDDLVAGEQMSEGRRNRALALHGQPVRVSPATANGTAEVGHYRSVEEAVLRSMSLTFFDDPIKRAWVRECNFLDDEKQYELAEEFLASPWFCDLAIAPGIHDWNAPVSGVFFPGEEREALIREGRGPQGISAECDMERVRSLRAANRGGIKGSDLCYHEREALDDECVTFGNWRMEEGTNGTVRGLHMLSGEEGNFSTRSTVEVCHGPWLFDGCDVRSVSGVCMWLTRELLIPFADECLRQRGGKGPEDKLREGTSSFFSPSEYEASDEGGGAEESSGSKEDKETRAEKQDRHEQEYLDDLFPKSPSPEPSSSHGASSIEPQAAWPPCGYYRKPRDADVRLARCAVGGVSDTMDTRAILGFVTMGRAELTVQDSTLEDTYNGARVIDCSTATYDSCLVQRNGVALSVAECALLRVQGCEFAEQRMSNLNTLQPPEKVSVFAIDGGNTGHGTVCFPAWGVGDGEQERGDKEVYWADTVLEFREPRMVLEGNRGDDSARLWLTPLRPGTLRGTHRLTDVGCQCERVLCHYDCQPQCTTADHKWRRRDPLRTGVCPLLAGENDFARGDDNYDKGGMATYLDVVTREQLAFGVDDEDFMKWDRVEVDRYRKAVKLREMMAACKTEEEREGVRLASRVPDDAQAVGDDEVLERYFDQYVGEDEGEGGGGQKRETRRERADARRKEDQDSEEREYQEILSRKAGKKKQERLGAAPQVRPERK